MVYGLLLGLANDSPKRKLAKWIDIYLGHDRRPPQCWRIHFEKQGIILSGWQVRDVVFTRDSLNPHIGLVDETERPDLIDQAAMIP